MQAFFPLIALFEGREIKTTQRLAVKQPSFLVASLSSITGTLVTYRLRQSADLIESGNSASQGQQTDFPSMWD